MTSENDTPRQGTHADIDEASLPPMPSRWDDPPSYMSDEELTRLVAAGKNPDPLLAATAEALWAPLDRNEAPAASAARLQKIVKDGEALRERWAETTALEEAYAAPSPTMEVRKRQALTRFEEVLEDLEKKRRRQTRLIRLAVVSSVLLTSTAILTMRTANDIPSWFGMASSVAGAMAMVGARLTEACTRRKIARANSAAKKAK
ncbi:hypothetical protein [Streptomyces sp. BPTC-684]|uniref:hypothetical protein n=1 Tax=Streptomyces sp. BPTC-684 TaxID=3043734 RepID=UPI0024B242CE|nr:hypothetical protein [Streptomyces sp. BPTC-684]WHM41151.1 hypothetical protein QIY60_32690 [Streptomyces sp. BPTC-684]